MAEEYNSAHVISLFRFRMRDLTPAQRQEYRNTAERLLTLASAMPGFISFRHYTSDDDGFKPVMVKYCTLSCPRTLNYQRDNGTAKSDRHVQKL